jgi:hypothetical protein
MTKYKRCATWAAASAVAFTFLFGAAPLSAAQRLHPGMWEFTTTGGPGETRTFQRCVTADEALAINGDTKSCRAYAEAHAKTCKITEYIVSGDSVTYAMTCGARTMRSTGTFHGDTSDGVMTVTMNGAAPVTEKVKAKRIGDCP